MPPSGKSPLVCDNACLCASQPSSIPSNAIREPGSRTRISGPWKYGALFDMSCNRDQRRYCTCYDSKCQRCRRRVPTSAYAYRVSIEPYLSAQSGNQPLTDFDDQHHVNAMAGRRYNGACADPILVDTSTAATPLAPSVEKAYYRKCIQLKRRLNEVEAANDEAKVRRVRLDRSIMKMRLERAFLLEQLSKRMENNADDSEGSAEEGVVTVSTPTGASAYALCKDQ